VVALEGPVWLAGEVGRCHLLSVAWRKGRPAVQPVQAQIARVDARSPWFCCVGPSCPTCPT